MTKPTPKLIALTSIRTDGGTQPRPTDDELAGQYAADLQEGDALPAVVVFHDGTDHWLADGFHRRRAHEMAGRTEILAEVREGSVRAARLHSFSANSRHGLRRTVEEAEHAIGQMLADAEWRHWSSRAIATACSCSAHLVEKVKASMGIEKGGAVQYERAGELRTMKTERIGRKLFRPASPLLGLGLVPDELISKMEVEAPDTSRPVIPPEGGAIVCSADGKQFWITPSDNPAFYFATVFTADKGGTEDVHGLVRPMSPEMVLLMWGETFRGERGAMRWDVCPWIGKPTNILLPEEAYERTRAAAELETPPD